MTEYIIHLAILMQIYFVLTLGLVLILGYGGFFTLAHMGIFGIGAYSYAILNTRTDFTIIPITVVSAVISILLALAIGGISLRLRSDYFAIGSLSFALVLQTLFMNWRTLTNGVSGIAGISRPELFGLTLNSNYMFLIYSTLNTLFALALIRVLIYSQLGRALVAQSEFEYGLSSIGISPTRIRLIAFAFSALFASLAGNLYASYMSFVDPSSFGLNDLVMIVAVVIFGGLRSLYGVTISVLIFILLPEILRSLNFTDEYVGALRQGIFALLLSFVVYKTRHTLFTPQRTI